MAIVWGGKFGGLADSKFSGVLGSFAECVGIDGHSTPGLLKAHQKLTKNSGTTIDALCRVRLATSDGSTLWFSYTTGKIWLRTSAGTWSLVYTTVPTDGDAGCLGAEEYDGYIYWATEKWLHRKPLGSISSWTDAAPNWKELTGGIRNTAATAGTVGTDEVGDSSGDLSWTSPSNALADDGNVAQSDVTAGQKTKFLFVKTFGFAIPSNAEITGVEVIINRFRGSILVGVVKDQIISLTDSGIGTPAGSNLADTATDWGTTEAATATYGGQSNMWGFTTAQLTPGVVNSAPFGVTIQAKNTDSVAGSARVDYVSMKIYYVVAEDAFHPMAKQNLQLFVGDGHVVAKVDNEGTNKAHQFTASALDINLPNRIKTMIPYDIDILLGTFIAASVNECQILRWDTESPSWVSDDTVWENGVNAFLRDDNYVYAQCGRFGRWYIYNGEVLEPFKRIPGDWSPTKTAEVYPQAVDTYLTLPVFGLSNVAGNPAKQGVYTFGSYSRDYSKVLDLSYVISPDVTSSVEIGAVLAIGGDLLVSWYDGTSYGVDLLDYTAKYASAYFETMMLFPGSRDIPKVLAGVRALYNSLPASTGFTISYSVNGGSYVALTDVDNSVLNQIQADLSVPDVGSLQVRVEFDVSGNTAPTLEALDILLE